MTWKSGVRPMDRAGSRTSTRRSKGTSWFSNAPSAVSRARSRSSRKAGSPDTSVRRTRVFMKQPTSSSRASSRRPATGEPIGTSSPAPNRDNNAARPAWSTMNTDETRLPRQPHQRTMSPRTKPERNRPTPVRHHCRPHTVERQSQLLRHPRQPLTPEPQLPRHHTRRIRLHTQQLPLPHREIRVLHGKFRPFGASPAHRAVYARDTSWVSGATDQPSAAMWWTTRSSRCSSGAVRYRWARRGISVVRSKPRPARAADTDTAPAASTSTASRPGHTSAASRTTCRGSRPPPGTPSADSRAAPPRPPAPHPAPPRQAHPTTAPRNACCTRRTRGPPDG